MKHFRVVFVLFLDCAALIYNAPARDILTNRGDLARTGLNHNETTLSPTNVSSRYFGLLYNNSVDGQVYAQPLYVTSQKIVTSTSQTRIADILYVATENDSLYAFDADSGVQYWQTSLLLSGETPVSSNDVDCSSAIQPEIGITATPVIDRSAGPNGTIFVVAMSKNGTDLTYRLHAIDLSTGQDRLTPVIISASVKGTGPATNFVARQQLNRAGLLLLNHVIYTTFGSFCDNPPYAGWIIGYNENNFSSTVPVFNTDPNGPTNDPTDPLGGSGSGIWQAGNGPSVDANNNIYVATGNGPFDSLNRSGFPAHGDFGDSVLKLIAIGFGGLAVSDYFTPSNELSDRNTDRDQGSGGPMVLDIVDSRGVTHHLLSQAGKDSNLYLLDRDNLGKFHSSNQIYQELDRVLPGGVWSSPAYFNGSIYQGCGPEGGAGPLVQLQFDFTNPNKPLLKSTPVSSTNLQFGFPGATPTISSNGTINGIVWAYERNNSGQAILHAYDATNLKNELFNSGSIGVAVKFVVPTVCNGKAFVGTSSSIATFGLTTPNGSGVAKDFNNDGNADLVWENTSTGQRSLWLLKNGTFQSSTTLPSPAPSWHIAGVGDFLGKGQSDLVLENTNTGAHVIWILDGGVYAFSILLPTVASGWHIVGAGDFDGDGQADLVWENTSGGQRLIWLLRNGIYQSYLLLPTVPPAWHIAGVGDFLGNGQSDLVLENTATGQHTIWLLQNGVLQKALPLPAASIYWHIAGVADFDGDGQADLVWENTSGGQRVIWLLKSGIYQGNYLVLPTASTQSRIVDH